MHSLAGSGRMPSSSVFHVLNASMCVLSYSALRTSSAARQLGACLPLSATRQRSQLGGAEEPERTRVEARPGQRLRRAPVPARPGRARGRCFTETRGARRRRTVHAPDGPPPRQQAVFAARNLKIPLVALRPPPPSPTACSCQSASTRTEAMPGPMQPGRGAWQRPRTAALTEGYSSSKAPRRVYSISNATIISKSFCTKVSACERAREGGRESGREGANARAHAATKEGRSVSARAYLGDALRDGLLGAEDAFVDREAQPLELHRHVAPALPARRCCMPDAVRSAADTHAFATSADLPSTDVTPTIRNESCSSPACAGVSRAHGGRAARFATSMMRRLRSKSSSCTTGSLALLISSPRLGVVLICATAATAPGKHRR
jgi:hypothetical protein